MESKSSLVSRMGSWLWCRRLGVVVFSALIISCFFLATTQRNSHPFQPHRFKQPQTPVFINSNHVGFEGSQRETRTKHIRTKLDQDFLTKLKDLNWASLTPEGLVKFLVPYNIKEPLVSVDESCRPDELPSVSPDLCSGNTQVFTGSLRSEPVKVIHAIKLGYDVDILEIHLNELYDVVDYFVITESIESHRNSIRKPLVWEMVKNQARFLKFHDKVVHFVLDDSDLGFAKGSNDIFSGERNQEKVRWTKLKKWSESKNVLQNDDIIGFGDADEVTNRVNLFKLRHCKLKVEVLDVASWFAYGDLTSAFQTDFPVKSLPYTLGNPSFWTYQKAKASLQYPTYQRGTSPSYILGGTHLTHYSYLPFLLVKSITATEADRNFSKLRQIVESFTKQDVKQNRRNVLKAVLKQLDDFMKMAPKTRFKPVEKLISENPIYKEIVHVPWFLQCNPDRYPSWYGKHLDPRLL